MYWIHRTRNRLPGLVTFLAICVLVLAIPGAVRFAGSAAAGIVFPVLEPGTHYGRVLVDCVSCRYFLHVPPAYDPASPAPLVVVFHAGGGSAGEIGLITGFSDLADRENFLVLYPESPRRIWDDGSLSPEGFYAPDDARLVDAVLIQVMEVANVDRGRVYATGLSSGACLLYRLAGALPGRFAAIAPVAGALGEEVAAGLSAAAATWMEDPDRTGRPASTRLTRPKPEAGEPSAPGYVPASLFIIHGTDDPILPWDGTFSGVRPGGGASLLPVEDTARLWAGLNGCSSEPEVTYLPDLDPGDGTRVRVERWAGGYGGTEVVLVAVEGGGHTWPGFDLHPARLGRVSADARATELIWSFFSEIPGSPAPGS